MALNSKLVDFLKKHKFTGKKEIIKYSELNNEKNTKTPTDITNEITKVFKSNQMLKEKAEIIEAIFDDGTNGKVSTLKDGSKTVYIYTAKKESFTIDWIIKDDVLIFTKGDKEATIEIELSQRPEKKKNWHQMRNDIINEMKNIESLEDFKKFASDYSNTK